MKTRLLALVLSAALASFAGAADSLNDLTRGSQGANSIAPPILAQGQLEILLAPIALYPDALVALVLPAATRPSDIVLASRFLKNNGSETEIDQQPWADSVKSLARFPEVIHFMDENLAWTQEIGDAFVAQPAEVMGAIQTLRARATRNGLLANTQQQEVVFDDDDTIRIIPTEPEIIYVPYYEPSYLYYTQSYTYYPSSLLWFGVGYGIGSWLNYDCDWGRRTVWVHHHHHNRSNNNYDWRRRYTPGWSSHVGGTDWTRWDPSPSHRRHRPRNDRDFGRLDTQRNGTFTPTTRTRDESRREFTASNPPESRNVRRPETNIGRTTPDLNQRAQPNRPRDTASTPRHETVAPPAERRAVTPNRRTQGETIERRQEVANPGQRNRESQRPTAAPAIVSRPAPAAVAPAVRSRPAPEVAAPSVRSRPAQEVAAPSVRSRPAPEVSAPREQTRSSPPPQIVARNESSRNSSPPQRRESRDRINQTEEN